MRYALPCALAFAFALVPCPARSAEVPVDFAGFPAGGTVSVEHKGATLDVRWPIGEGRSGRMVLDLTPGSALVERLSVIREGKEATVLRAADPATFVTVGRRVNPPDRPAGMSVFNVFFDSPADRPRTNHRATLDPRSVRVTGNKLRATVSLGGLSAGPFSGEQRFTVYAGSPLVHVEAVMATNEPERAFLYDAGLVSRAPSWDRLSWFDTEGRFQSAAAKADDPDRPLAVRHRAVVASSDNGSLACFPPPHQFFFPRDDTDNQKTVWFGRGHRGQEDRPGFGVRQTEKGGGRYVPWFNAPPGTSQHMGAFYLLHDGPAEQALREALRYTNGDRFPDLPGHVTFTSHWHMAIAVAAMREIERGGPRTTPDFVRMFKDMNVQIVHLAEFHGDGHPQDPGPLRLPEVRAMFDECRRLSDDTLTFLPGEEANVHFGVSGPGQNPGHWLYFFPRPVYWTMKRAPGQPFEETVSPYGKVYRAGNRDDLVRLLRAENGLAWTAHARIKASNFAPDAYRDASYFTDPLWLGAAWKAMPADLSRPKLGERVLDLLDDMANWGQKKYAPGEVDVFKIDRTHELYGHMNINYLRLGRAPRYADDWTPVLDALRHGRFFVTTGEVLLTDFRVAGAASGETVPPSDAPLVTIGLRGTFPLAFAEVVSGDGNKVYRQRIDLSETAPFLDTTLTLYPDLKGRKWVRVEAWDVAANGAFSQPVWLERAGP